MARGGAITGRPSAPLPKYPVEEWTCDGCGRSVEITLTPNALAKGAFKHITCRNGYFRPEPGRET